MTKIRKIHSKQTKFKAALDMYKGDKTITQLSQDFAVHQSILHKWKKILLEEGPNLFEDQRKKKAEVDPTADLQRKIGQLIMENDFLKKPWGNR